MSKIETGIFSSLLRRYLLMKGDSNVADELAPEISPVFVLEEERSEWEFLKGHRLLSWQQSVIAQAASNSGARIRNPATSGVVGIVTYVALGGEAGGNTAITTTFGAQSADLATTSGNCPRDGRMIPPTGGALIPSFGYAGVGGSAVDLHNVSSTGGSIPTQNNPRGVYIITPGFALNFTASPVQTTMHVAVHWLEKRLDDLERAN